MIYDRSAVRPGVHLWARYRGEMYGARVVDDGAGGIAIELDGALFASLSAAARDITGTAMNGWRFWNIDEEPAPDPRPAREPHAVLGIPYSATMLEATRAYRALAKKAHPDAGGSHEAMVELNTAYDAVKAWIEG